MEPPRAGRASAGAPQALLILGTRSLALEIADLADEIPGVRVAGFVENMERERCEGTLHELPVHWVDDIAKLATDHLAVCGLATTHRRRFVDQVAALGMGFATLVHPSASVSRRSLLGRGCIVSRGVMIASHTRIGDHVLLNRGVLVGHHTEVERYATVQPGANVAGLCHIGEGSFIGMGAVVFDRIRVGSGAVVGAAAVVTRDVPEGVQVVGAPARIVKRGVSGR